jgi:hypothetical protein
MTHASPGAVTACEPLILYVACVDVPAFEVPGASYSIEWEGWRYAGCILIDRELIGDGRAALTFHYAMRTQVPTLH